MLTSPKISRGILLYSESVRDGDHTYKVFVVIAFVDQILWRPTWPDLGHCFHWAAISGDYC